MILDNAAFPRGPLATDWNPFTEVATAEKAGPEDECQYMQSSRAGSIITDSKRNREYLSTGLTILVVTQLVGISFITSFSNGILAVGLPKIASDVNLPQNLLLWPSSVGYLASGTFLLLGGALSDVAGPKLVNLIGCASLTASTVTIGLSGNSLQLIIFRAWQGVAFALAYPSSTTNISLHVRSGPCRNVGFACIGFSMVFGFMSGYFVGAVAWRLGHYIGAVAGLCLLVLGTWALPSDSSTLLEQPTISSLVRKVDWIGACIAGSFLALIMTVLSMVSANVKSIQHPINICMLVVGGLLILAFPLWMHYREACKLPALIPNALWTTNTAFTCICFMMLIAGAVQNSQEILLNVQDVSPIDTSLRILPTSIFGCILNLVTGRLIHLLPPVYPAVIATVISSASPLIMVFVHPAWTYRTAEFWSVLFSSLSGDVIYTIGLLIAADAFPEHCQGLAGALFNVFYFLGGSVGLAVVNIFLAKDQDSRSLDESMEPRLSGFHASFWTLFGIAIASAVIGAFGLRKLGKIGQRRGYVCRET